MTPVTRRSAASIRARLLARARREGIQFQRILVRYASERLLYRLSISPATDRFILKGALLFDLWYDSGFRPTRDIDLSGQGDPDMPDLIQAFTGLCVLDVDDGIIFDPLSVDASPIRDRARYHGVSLTLDGLLDGARCKVKIDIGFVLWVIMKDHTLDRPMLSQAVGATLRRRGTPYPDNLPVGLTAAFAEHPLKQSQWSTFLSRSGLDAPALPVIVALLRDSLRYLFEGTAHTTPPSP